MCTRARAACVGGGAGLAVSLSRMDNIVFKPLKTSPLAHLAWLCGWQHIPRSPNEQAPMVCLPSPDADRCSTGVIVVDVSPLVEWSGFSDTRVPDRYLGGVALTDSG